MRRLLLAAVLLALTLPLSAARPPDFCEKRPTHPHCRPAPTPTATPTPTPAPGTPQLLFGLGPEADAAVKDRLVSDAPVNMLSSWYNGPGDLGWMTGWGTCSDSCPSFVERMYDQGFALHLIVWSDVPEVSLSTQYGPACGRAYPLSSRFLGDMQQLADTFAPRAPGDRLYVTLFTEFQTFPCTDNQWLGSENYYRALKDQYTAAKEIFRSSGGKVSLGWGGWQSRWDDPAKGGGRSLFPHFADVMDASDFTSFQAMQGDSNVSDVREMTRILGAHGPVMQAHWGLDPIGQGTTQSNDMHTMLTDAYIAEVTGLGLFAFSFMHPHFASEELYTFVRDGVRRFGAP
jgi:hypothetical protein